MAAGWNMTSAQDVLKQTYAEGLSEIDYENNRLMSVFESEKGKMVATPFGSAFVVPIRHGTPQTESSQYTTSELAADTESSRYEQFLITPSTTYWHAKVAGDLIRRGDGSGSFIDAMDASVEDTTFTARRGLSVAMYRNGFGDRGIIASDANIASATLKLQAKWMVRFFEKGMQLQASQSEFSHVLRSTVTKTVVGRNVSAQTITLNEAANANASNWAVGDTLFLKDDRQNSATPTRRKFPGLRGWVPRAAPVGGENFYGADRSLDDRLGGIRADATLSGSCEDAILDLLEAIGAEGGTTTDLICGPTTLNKILKSMTSKSWVDVETRSPTFGFKGVKFEGGSGSPALWSDINCPEGEVYAINRKDWRILYAGDDFLYVDQTDGLFFRKANGEDAWVAFLVSCAAMSCNRPGHQGVSYNFDLL